MNSDPSKLLRDKATLLIRREREIFELRHERRRTEEWLSAFYRLAAHMQTQDAGTILSEWAGTLTGNLGFQIAAVFACSEDLAQLHLLHHQAHCTLKSDLQLDSAASQFLQSKSSGCFMDVEPAQLQDLSRSSGLQQFFWLFLSGRGTRLLLLTGYSRSAGRFHSLSEHDLGHFVLLGNHIAALLDNIKLIEELGQERSELRNANEELDRRLQELNEAQLQLISSSKKLAEISRRAGMADIATGVLHNVGNALNSVNVSAELVVARVRAMKLVGVSRAAEMLRSIPQERLGDRRLEKAAQYLTLLGEQLAADWDTIVNEMRSLQQNVDHIKSIVAKQQVYTKSVGLLSPCSPVELVEDALKLVEASIGKERIEVVRHYEETPTVLIDQHKVIQILVNLLSNAKHSLVAANRDAPRITLRTLNVVADTETDAPVGRVRHDNGRWRGEDRSGYAPRTVRRKPPREVKAGAHGSTPQEQRIQMIVEDNGVGVAASDMTNLFTYGFTTRSEGHGFGLHTSALAAQDMGGRLLGFSDGPGRGARFVLELPAASSELPVRASGSAKEGGAA